MPTEALRNYKLLKISQNCIWNMIIILYKEAKYKLTTGHEKLHL